MLSPLLLVLLFLEITLALGVIRRVVKGWSRTISKPTGVPLATAPPAELQPAGAHPVSEQGSECRPEAVLSVFYASLKGRSSRLAQQLVDAAIARGISATLTDLRGVDVDKLADESLAVFVVATYEGGSAPEGCESFFHQLNETAQDFRVSKVLYLSTILASACLTLPIPLPSRSPITSNLLGHHLLLPADRR